jgi:hypothetical protein
VVCGYVCVPQVVLVSEEGRPCAPTCIHSFLRVKPRLSPWKRDSYLFRSAVMSLVNSVLLHPCLRIVYFTSFVICMLTEVKILSFHVLEKYCKEVIQEIELTIPQNVINFSLLLCIAQSVL